MAYADLNTIHNPSTGTSPPASWGDQVRDNFEFLNTLVGAFSVGFVDWVPTITQAVSVAKTILSSGQVKLGRFCFCFVTTSITGAGTASNIVTLSTPHTAAHALAVVGSGRIYDASVNLNHIGTAELATSTTFAVAIQGSNNFAGASIFTAGLASTDAVYLTAIFETAS